MTGTARPFTFRAWTLDQLRQQRQLVGRFAVSSIGRTACSILIIFLLKEFLTGVLGEGTGWAGRLAAAVGSGNALWVLVAGLAAVFAAGAAFNYANQIVAQRLMRGFELGLMERLIAHLLRQPVGFLEQQHHGDVLEAVRNDVSRTRTAIMGAIDVLVQAAQALAYLVSAVIISPLLAVVSLPILIGAAVPMRVLAARVRQRSRVTRRQGYLVNDLLLQVLRGIRIVKIYGGEDAETRNTVSRARRYFSELMATVRARALGNVVVETLAGLSVVLVTVIGGLQVMSGSLGVSSLVAFLIATRAMYGPLNNTATQLLEIERNMASIERIRELLRTVPNLADRPDAVPITGPVRSLRFENVSFRYPNTTDGVLGIDFEVRAGERIGVVGPSGSGKTTLVSLVARFYDPSAGRVVLNDRDLRDYRLADFHRHLAIVTQQPFVFETTVRENIRYGRPGASDEEVEDAARLAEIHDEIEALPQGYATELGAGGRGLSGGQAQRLNIARALLKNAPILILDEATSSIDSIAETKLQAAVARLLEGRTTFEIAHRLSTLRGVDRIIVMDRGRLIAIGTHEELLATCQLYRALSASQAREKPTVVPGLAVG